MEIGIRMGHAIGKKRYEPKLPGFKGKCQPGNSRQPCHGLQKTSDLVW